MQNGINIAWCAGFMSADGCFTWCGGNDGKGGTPLATVSQVQPHACEKFADIFGGEVKEYSHKSSSSGTIFRVDFYGQKAISLMKDLYPLLAKPKQDDVAKVIYKWWNMPSRGHVNASKTHCKNGHEYTEENTYHKKSGGRECRICQKAANRRYLDRKKNLGVANG